LDIKSPEFYAEIGLISGLEVHQQLLTERKMFCHCPARRYTDTHDGEVLRHMRPTLSELGEYDGTALMEFKTRKNIILLKLRDELLRRGFTRPDEVGVDSADVTSLFATSEAAFLTAARLYAPGDDRLFRLSMGLAMRDLLEIVIVPLDNMLPETALMKLSWVLAHTDDHERCCA